MEKLFGIPIGQLTLALLVVVGLAMAAMTIVALRQRVMFKVAIRNIPRRKAQTFLIILGLMLATMLFSASFTTGDTLTHSIRVAAMKDLGEVDLVVAAKNRQASGRPTYFDQAYSDAIRESLADDSDVDGVAPLVWESMPVVAPVSRQSEPWVSVMGLSQEWMSGFDSLVDQQGVTLPVDSLNDEQVYVSSGLADELKIVEGQTVQVFLGSEPATFEVAAIYDRGANPGGKLSLVMAISRLQAMTGNEGKITQVLITNKGDGIGGAEHSDAVVSTLEPLLEGTGLEASPWKQDALDMAEEWGSTISTIFFVLAQFSIAAGILLIFLIFVMLAAERKKELGIARAVGTQRSQLIGMFTLEGAVYSMVAAVVGSLLGVVIGLGMVRVMGIAFGGSGLDIAFSFNWQNVALAYLLGLGLTLAVVLFSSWRVSRLNIVRAVRDIPEPSSKRGGMKGLLLSIMMPILGAFLGFMGYQNSELSFFMLGVSLVVIGVPVLARRIGLPDRLAFTLAGGGLVIWWLLPFDTFDAVLPGMNQGFEMFFLSGIMLVVGAVWVVTYNADIFVKATTGLFGRFRGLSSVVKIAVTYPMQSLLRTGMTLAMFSLVVFTLTTMGIMVAGSNGMYENTERLSGGYHIRADANPANPIADIREALEEGDEVALYDFAAVASFNGSWFSIKQDGIDKDPVENVFIRGVDSGYTDSVTHGFALMADGYHSPRDVWQALQEEPGTAVVAYWMVPSRNGLAEDGEGPSFKFEGFFLEDSTLPEVYLVAEAPHSGRQQRLRVIGVLKDGSRYVNGVMSSQDTLNNLTGQSVPTNSYMLRLADGVDANTIVAALESRFLVHGMEAMVIEEEIREEARISRMMFMLLQGFMALGLIVGIAALGVIAARSVVERRKQIGMLRALGFQKGMVQLSFLLESSFISLLGIGIGVALGMLLSYNSINELKEQVDGMRYSIPWVNIITIVLIAYGASLLTTFMPARGTAKVYPSEALRVD